MTLDKAILTLKDSLFLRRDAGPQEWTHEEWEAASTLTDWAAQDFEAALEEEHAEGYDEGYADGQDSDDEN